METMKKTHQSGVTSDPLGQMKCERGVDEMITMTREKLMFIEHLEGGNDPIMKIANPQNGADTVMELCALVVDAMAETMIWRIHHEEITEREIASLA